MVRVVIPYHLRNLAKVDGEVKLGIEDSSDAPLSLRMLLDALEKQYPMLRGTIRDHTTLERRPFLRYFACEQDLSLQPPDAPLPEAVRRGAEQFIVLGSIAGG
jgi:molybdopterin synthase sulfur carrier subunit